MSILDRMKNAIVSKTSSAPISTSMSGGIGSGHGMVPFDDDMIVSKPAIVLHTSQIFFNFLAMACFASVASFQAKWGVGPSGLTGFAIFISVAGIFLSLFMLLVPVIYEKYDRFNRLARALKEARVSFILTGAGAGASLLIAFIVTISAWTEPGCKNPADDPNAKAKGQAFQNGLANWCNTKKAGAIFFWFTFAFWVASVGLLIMDMRSGKLAPPRDPPFTRPSAPANDEDEEQDDVESAYNHIPPARRPTVDNSNSPNSPFADTGSAMAVGRPSMDTYGAFSDPPPSGFGSGGPPVIPEVDVGPRVSRTMQYADPYAAVRASVASGGGSAGVATPPSYESYQGYR